ncbi:hypothetical protein NKG94_02400 [Micromonospora sp. M12]
MEVSPHPVLTGAVTQTAEEYDSPVTVTGTLRRGADEPTTLLGSIGTAYGVGAPVDVSAWTSGGRLVDLPTYPFERERYWLPSAPAVGDVRAAGLGAVRHPLLGAAIQLAGTDGLVCTGRVSHHPSLARRPCRAGPGTDARCRVRGARSARRGAGRLSAGA